MNVYAISICRRVGVVKMFGKHRLKSSRSVVVSSLDRKDVMNQRMPRVRPTRAVPFYVHSDVMINTPNHIAGVG